METENKISFFEKLKIAIFNLEKYGVFITENFSKSLKYILILVVIYTLCSSILYAFDSIKMIDKGINYIRNEMPDFRLENGEITFDSQVNGYDKEYDFKIISIDETQLTDKELNEYKKYSKSLILLKDKIVLNVNGMYNEYSYNYIKESFNINDNNKQGLINLYDELGGNIAISITLMIMYIFIFFIINAYQMIFNCLIVAIFGYFVARICKIKIRFSTATTLAIYSLTLSIILNLIYTIQYYFTGFEIQYFNWLYLAIAYIYMVAAILIIKTDLIKQLMELQRIEEIQKKIVKEEIKEEDKEQKKDDKNDENKKEKKKDKEEDDNLGLDKEPDGSEI